MVASIIPTALADEVVRDDTKAAAEENQVELYENDIDDVIPESSQEDTDTPAEDIEGTSEPQETELPPAKEESESIPDELTAEPQEVDEVDIEEIDASIELMATGTYYPEYKFYFDENSGTITGADKTISGSISFPNEINGVAITSIGNRAFENCDSIERVEKLPDSLVRIGYSAFAECDSLIYIKIPKSVTETGTESSYPTYYGNWVANCKLLNTIEIENEATAIPREAFADSYASNIIIPSTVTELGYGAFRDSKGLETIPAMKGIITIGNRAFENCDSLRKVDGLPSTLTSIGYRAFADCDVLEYIKIPRSVTQTGTESSYPTYYGNWFSNCASLKGIELEFGSTIIPRDVFANITANAYIYCPSSITQTANTIFSNSQNLTIICDESALILPYAIDNGLNFRLTHEITEYKHFNFSNTEYYSNINSMTGYVPFEVKFDIRNVSAQ